MNCKLLLSLFCLILWQSIGFSQDDHKQKAIYLEIAGSGGLGSINYEQTFFTKDRFHLNWRAGLSLAPVDKNNGVGIVFPLMVHGNYGNSSHQLDVGFGQGLTFTSRGNFFALTTASVGYKYNPSSKKIFLRFSYTPLISYLLDFQYQHWGGVSIGYSFNKAKK